MEEYLHESDSTLKALDTLERYVFTLDGLTTNSGRNEFFRIGHELANLLNQNSLSSEVRQVVHRIASACTRSRIAMIDFLERENKRQCELLSQENKRKIELLEEKNKQKDEQTRRRKIEYFIVVLYVLTIFAVFWVKDWKLVFACFPISFIEYRLLNDTLPFRVWGWFWTKRKDD